MELTLVGAHLVGLEPGAVDAARDGVELAAERRHPPAVDDVGRVDLDGTVGVDRDDELVVGEDVGKALPLLDRGRTRPPSRPAGRRVLGWRRVLVAPDPLLADGLDLQRLGARRGCRRLSWARSPGRARPRRRSPSRCRRRRRRTDARAIGRSTPATRRWTWPPPRIRAGSRPRSARKRTMHQISAALIATANATARTEHHPVDRGDVLGVRRVSGLWAQGAANLIHRHADSRLWSRSSG